MKKALFVLLAYLCIGNAVAQQTQIATLTHDGNNTIYYSSSAFVDAYNAAVDGDVITLSEGAFTSPDKIYKFLTVRGAGMNSKTVIMGYITFYLNTNGEENSFDFESVEFANLVDFQEQSRVNMLRCGILDKARIAYGTNHNVKFVNCVINNMHVSAKTTCNIINSCLIDPETLNYSNIFNTVIVSNTRSVSNANNATSLRNCVVKSNKSSYKIGYDKIGIISHCVFIGCSGNSDTNAAIVLNNLNLPADTEVFKDDETYELTDENAANWLGDDGTQVGMYGGTLPFDPTPTNPQITKFNIASKTTADGKLSVDIEVKAQ